MLHQLPFEAVHLRTLELQEQQKWFSEYMIEDKLKTLENQWAITIMDGERPLACGGPTVIWDNRALLWSFLSKDICPTNFRKFHHIIKKYIDSLPFRRMEAMVDVDFRPGHRWMRSLEFVCEAPVMKAIQLNGKDSALYARVRI